MFTGIITDVGTIDAIEQRGDLRVRVRAAYDMAGVDLGASIACSGVCLTVVDKDEGWFAVDVSTETVRRTAQGQWTVGRRLNLERALQVGDELGGHIFTGHVAGVGEIAPVAPEGASQGVGNDAGAQLAPFLEPKGARRVDGVS